MDHFEIKLVMIVLMMIFFIVTCEFRKAQRRGTLRTPTNIAIQDLDNVTKNIFFFFNFSEIISENLEEVEVCLVG